MKKEKFKVGVMMTEIQTIEGGQKDVPSRRAKVKKMYEHKQEEKQRDDNKQEEKQRDDNKQEEKQRDDNKQEEKQMMWRKFADEAKIKGSQFYLIYNALMIYSIFKFLHDNNWPFNLHRPPHQQSFLLWAGHRGPVV